MFPSFLPFLKKPANPCPESYSAAQGRCTPLDFCYIEYSPVHRLALFVTFVGLLGPENKYRDVAFTLLVPVIEHIHRMDGPDGPNFLIREMRNRDPEDAQP